MSAFYAHFYSGMQWTALPVLALFLFLGTFVAAVVRVCLASRRKEIEAAARLPFDDRETIVTHAIERRARS
jgi:cbb3-type cytochrome oxidase subunit 3